MDNKKTTVIASILGLSCWSMSFKSKPPRTKDIPRNDAFHIERANQRRKERALRMQRRTPN